MQSRKRFNNSKWKKRYDEWSIVTRVIHVEEIKTFWDSFWSYGWTVSDSKGDQVTSSRMRHRQQRSFVVQTSWLVFEQPRGRHGQSSADDRELERRILTVASRRGTMGRYRADICRQEDQVWSRFLNVWEASAGGFECRPRWDRTFSSEEQGGPQRFFVCLFVWMV